MPIQQGIEGRDARFLRRDGSVPLSASWAAGAFQIQSSHMRVILGGAFCLGQVAGVLRISHDTDEILKITGVSDNEAELLQKNATMTDLAGVGVRAVMADVNGKLSAP